MNTVIYLHSAKGEARVDSRIIAQALGNQHGSVMKLVEDYRPDFDVLGVVRFQIGEPPSRSKGGRPERFALLNEDQAYLLLTFSRNSVKSRSLKVGLVKAFSRFREGKQIESDYFPFYHAMHGGVKALAARAQDAGSATPKTIFHINVNWLINQAYGLKCKRLTPPPTRRCQGFVPGGNGRSSSMRL